MAEIIQTTGYNADTGKHLLLDAGAFYKNFGETDEKLLGATKGGGEFVAKPKIRSIEIDGLKGEAKGLKVLDSWEVSISGNMLEITKEILQQSLFGEVDSTTDTDYDIITAKNKISESDYLKNITWVGVLSGSAKPVIIKVFNALNTEGISLKTEDKKENVLHIKFIGHYDATSLDKPPFEIKYPKLA